MMTKSLLKVDLDCDLFIFEGTRTCPDHGCSKFLTWLTEHFSWQRLKKVFESIISSRSLVRLSLYISPVTVS